MHFTRCTQPERMQATHVRRDIVEPCAFVRLSPAFSAERTSCSSSLFLSEDVRLRLCTNQCHPSVERRAVATSSPLFSSPSVLRVGAPAERSPAVLNHLPCVFKSLRSTEPRESHVTGRFPSFGSRKEGFRCDRASAFNCRF